MVAAASVYLSEIAAAPLMDAAGERALARRVAGGDAEARDLLVRANLRLVVALARSFRGRGVDFEDLVAEGNLGLMRACEGFDPGAGTRFATYAAYWIKQSMRAAAMKHGEPVRLPQHVVSLLGKWHRASTRLSGSLGREATPAEVSATLGLSGRRAGMVSAALAVKAAMPRQPADAGSDLEQAESAVDRSASVADVVAEEDEAGAALVPLGRLDPRSRELIRLRFGLGGEPSLTLREIGERLGLTRERVRQIERSALGSLARA